MQRFLQVRWGLHYALYRSARGRCLQPVANWAPRLSSPVKKNEKALVGVAKEGHFLIDGIQPLSRMAAMKRMVVVKLLPPAQTPIVLACMYLDVRREPIRKR